MRNQREERGKEGGEGRKKIGKVSMGGMKEERSEKWRENRKGGG